MGSSIKSSRERHRQYREERGFFGQRRPPGGRRRGRRGGEDFKPNQPLRHYLRRYFGELRGFRGYVAALVVMAVFGMGLRAVLPWTSKFMIDTVLPMGELSLLIGTCAILFGVAVADVAMSSISDYTSRLLGNKLQIHMRRRMIEHLQAMPLEKLDRLKTGGIISRLEGDVRNFSSLLHEAFLTPFAGLLMFAIAIGSLLLISPLVTMICCAFCLTLFFFAYLVFNVMRPLFRDIREDISKISGKLAETFGGIRVVRCFGREPRESREFVTAHHLVLRKNLHTGGLNIMVHRSVSFIHWCMEIAIWGTAGYFVIHDQRLTIGEVVVFVQFTHWFFQPVFMIMNSLSSMQDSIACTERIFDLLDEEISIKDAPDAISVGSPRGAIRFEKVEFAYEPDKPVLRGVDFEIPAGRTVALVGPSGAGKTTITNLMVRFHDPSGGRVALGGRDIRGFRLREYRGLFSLVLQDVFLFDGTVAENVSYSRPEATMEEIMAAAKAAHADEFVSAFPDGYDTVIGERGVKLSGGQKQRISLARAILRDPEVLILDEATSSLDSESEALIQDALKRILHERTTLVIAHRLSTIMDADKIVVLVDGRVVEEGTHGELLARRGKYYDMFTKQMEKATGAPAFIDWDGGGA